MPIKNRKAIGFDKIFTEEIKHFFTEARKWMKDCVVSKNILKELRKVGVMALLKPSKQNEQRVLDRCYYFDTRAENPIDFYPSSSLSSSSQKICKPELAFFVSSSEEKTAFIEFEFEALVQTTTKAIKPKAKTSKKRSWTKTSLKTDVIT